MSLPIYETSSNGKPADPNLIALADQAAAKYAIPPNILKAMFRRESDWDPTAVGDNGRAIGLGQLHDAAAADMGVNRYDTAQNVDGAAKYLRAQYNAFGNWQDALGAYNQGAAGYRGDRNATGKAYANAVLKIAGEDVNDSSQAMVNDTSGPAVGTTDSQGVGAWFNRNSKNLALLVLGIVIIVVAVMRTDAGKSIVVEVSKAAGD